ncbi:MAG TPA: cyclic nucleotide-binding domain-containing protein, partial [Kiloniellales bacterium]
MSFPGILTYAALALLVAAFWFPTIIWLRMVAIAASAVIAVHGLLVVDYLAAALGVALIGVNAWRLIEMRRLVSVTREATASSGAPITLDWLLPYMRPLALPKDTIVFHKGAAADAMYFVSHGRVRFEELDVEMGKGALFGEIGIFSHDKLRTATAKCMEDCSLLQISAEKVRELYYQNPDFGFFIVGLITR